MKGFVALIQREFLEHRGAFFMAPLIITATLMAMTIFPWLTGRVTSEVSGTLGSSAKIYEFGYLIAGGIWLAYLIIALVFYHADAFWADRRNNALLFWKSMPQSDFKILMSKLVAGITLFPAIILCVIVIAGLWLYVLMVVASLAAPVFSAPTPPEALSIFVNATLLIAVFVALVLLWYLPFMAWVGALSTLVGRWSLPLAVLVPALIIMLENMIGLPGAPPGGHVWAYLSQRLQFTFGQENFERYVLGLQPLDAGALLGFLLVRIDWLAMVLGWAFALLVVYLASERRRRGIEAQ